MNSDQASSIVNKLFALSQDTTNQPVIVRRGVLPSLVTFLKNENLQIQITACETLKNLVSHPDNQKIMSTEPGLVESIIKMFNDKHTHATLRSHISDILIYLSDYLSDEQKESTLSLKVVLESMKKSELDKKRSLVIHVAELKNEKERQNIQKVMLKTKGTISCTFNLHTQEMTLFTRTKSKNILSILENMGYKINLVSEDVLEESSSDMDKENATPSYLESKKYSSHSKAIVCETLAERMDKRKKQREEEESGFFGKITSYFW